MNSKLHQLLLVLSFALVSITVLPCFAQKGLAKPEPAIDEGWIIDGDPKCLPTLIGYLENGDEVAQRASLDSIASLGGEAAGSLPSVLRALQDASKGIRLKAAETVIHIAKPENPASAEAIRIFATELRSGEADDFKRTLDVVNRLADPPVIIAYYCWGGSPPKRIPRPWIKPAIEKELGIQLWLDWQPVNVRDVFRPGYDSPISSQVHLISWSLASNTPTR